ncbi:MAG: glycosyltransferase [Schleiferiaceae bacterium]
MFIAITTLAALFILELVFTLFLTRGWLKVKENDFSSAPDELQKISVVIPFKDEAHNIPYLLQSIGYRDLSGIELLFVDDHSTDGSAEMISEFFPVLTSAGRGKKAALRTGIEAASHPWIWQLDADVLLPNDFFQNLRKAVTLNHKAAVLGAPVRFSTQDSRWNHTLATEFASLIGSSISFIGFRKPIMLNGASLGYRKDLWLEYFNQENLDIASGDDVFLAHYAVSKMGKDAVGYLKNSELVVSTVPPQTIEEFVDQRVRWASKSTHYTYWPATLTTWYIGLTQLSIVVGILAAVLVPELLPYVLAYWGGKVVLNSLYLILPLRLLGQSSLLPYSFVVGFFYPFYVSYIGIRSLRGGYEWKSVSYQR